MDTTRADHLSHAGWKNDTTPNLSRLLDDAVLYSQARSVATWTLPAHMSMFTGLLPGEHRATWAAMDAGGPTDFVSVMRHPFQPPFPERMLASVLKERGYNTVGVSSNPWVSRRTGFHLGFDALYPVWRSESLPDSQLPASPLELSFSPELAASAAGKALLAFNYHLRGHGLEKPCFLFFNFIDPHYPYVADGEKGIEFGGDRQFFRSMENSATRKKEIDIMAHAETIDFEELVPFYDSSIHRADWAVGELLSWLERHDLYDDTLIIVTSDHGEHLGEQGRFSHQFSVEEELLRVPLIIKYPGSRGGGAVDDNPFASVADVYATILTAVDGAEDPASYSRDLRQGFDRPYAVAEYYFSDSFLRRFLRSNKDFDVESHRTILRVIYAGRRKYVFKDDALEGVDALASGLPRDEELEIRMTEWMQRYIASNEPVRRGPGLPAHMDAQNHEFIEALRALGYVR